MIKIELTQGKFAIIDDSVLHIVKKFRWYAQRNNKKFYAATNIFYKGKKTALLMHRLIMNALPDQVIDHINGDGLDNRRKNMRICTRSENAMNRGKTMSNKSGYKGVSWSNVANKWKVQIMKGQKNKHLGLFEDVKEAARVYNEAAKKYHGEFAVLNDID